MRPLQITLFLIALIILTTQTFRHAYVKWIEPRTSVLDEFSESVEKNILSAKSLEELASLYSEANRKVKEDQKKTNEDSKENSEQTYQMLEREPYKSEEKLKRAIQTWESHSKEIYELRFFWGCGLLSILMGLVCYQYVSRWLGLAGVISGFSEMIWWTCPSFRVFGANVEFDRLLTEKLIFSVLSWILLVCLWFLLSRQWSPSVDR